jgi:hypothetical protein
MFFFCAPQFSYAASNDTFETHKYCWMSTKKGMIFNFMIPISFLIIVTTVFGEYVTAILRINDLKYLPNFSIPQAPFALKPLLQNNERYFVRALKASQRERAQVVEAV